MSNFRPIDRETRYLLPPSVDDWLARKHLARFVVEVIDGLDVSAMSRAYRGSGSASYYPRLLLGILVYGYATGVFSSRKLERATYDSVAFRFIAANDYPDHDTIATFRRRFLKEIEGLFVQVLLLAREMGLLKMGTVALDGSDVLLIATRQASLTKVHANASKHSPKPVFGIIKSVLGFRQFLLRGLDKVKDDRSSRATTSAHGHVGPTQANTGGILSAAGGATRHARQHK
jgi:transposase